MKILFLTQILPYPPDAGPKVKTWHVLRYLVTQGHEITLASFVRQEEEQYLDIVRGLGIELFPVPIRRSRAADFAFLLRSNLTGIPFLIERDNLPAMRRLVNRLISERNYDVIHADQFTMTQFAPMNDGRAGHPVRVFDAHNANWLVLERVKANARLFLKPVLALEQQRLKRYEGRIVKRFEHTLAVTDNDRALLLEAVRSVDPAAVDGAGKRMITIPIAVDTKTLQPAARKPLSRKILTLGTLHYQPNADGIRWFLNEVFPRVREAIPDAALTIIGKNPPADFLQAARQMPDAVQVTGYVEDLSPYFDESSLMVVPVRAGGGMRVRILEAFARAMPVVTTTTGLEGIDARPGEDVLVVDSPADFADQVIRLACDPALQARLAENSRRLAERSYDWQAVLSRLEVIYGNKPS